MPSVLRPVLASAAFLSVSGLLLVAAPQTQDASERAMLEKIKVEGLGRSQAMATFTHFVDVVGPRLTATPAYKAAAEWSRDRLTEWGLANARLESWEFGRGWQLEKFTLEMVEPRYMPLMGYPEGWSASMPAEITAAPLLVAGKTAEELAAMKSSLAGAILLTQPAQPFFIRTDRGQPTDANYVPPPPATGRGQGGARGGGRGQSVQQVLREAAPAVVLRTSARRARHDVRARPRSR